ncbi:MAG: Ig-like domain-containing protein [Granulosicoccus sp.]
MDRKFLAIVFMAFSILLSACGQRPDAEGGFGTDPTDTTGDISVRVITNVNSITTGGIDTATITALVSDENNNALAGASVILSTTSGVLQDLTTISDENGEVSATLKLPLDYQNQNIVVSADVQGITSEASLAATGSAIEVTGPDNLVSGDEAELVISLVAGNDEPIANHPISVVSTAGNLVSPTFPMTGPDGRATLTVGTTNGDDEVRISALNGTVSAEHEFEVSQDILRFEEGVEDTELPVAQTNAITVTWSSQSQPVVGQLLLFSTTAGEIVGNSSITTDANGQATVQIRSNSYGPVKLTVEDASDSRPKTSADLEFVGTTPATISLDASVSRVEIGNTSTLMASVRDAQGNPVKNQIVDFSSLDLKGGQISPASATSNSEGVASVTFTAGSNATEANDISVNATVKGTSITNSMNLSVTEKVLNVTLGTSNLLTVRNFDTQYAVAFVAQVADGGGAPIEGADVALSITPIRYFKGWMDLLRDEEGVAIGWNAFVTAICESEDINGNRILDAGEDRNGNGSLDPQDPVILAAVEDNPNNAATIVGGTGVLTTDGTGSGFFEIRYPKSHSVWATVAINAHAEALGTEAISSFEKRLSLLAVDGSDPAVSPPNAVSPYGTSVNCFDTE